MTPTPMRDPRYTATYVCAKVRPRIATCSYGNEDLDVYDAPDSPTRPLIVFVHGGAWRAERKEQHSALAIRIRDLTGCPVAVLDYRLTKGENGLKHPGHAKDVLDALRFLTAWPDGAPFDATRLYLIGHSAGAHILTSIFLDAAASFTPLPADNDYLRPEHSLLRAVRGIAIASGIYDLEKLIATFPEYDKRFVKAAFREPYEFWNTTRYPLHGEAHPHRWHVIHSTGDTLVDSAQSEAIFAHLKRLYAERQWDEARVTKDWDTLSSGHHYVALPQFAQLIADWVTNDMSVY
ncbi:Alpha/Beta hydrolase protein [Gautieria morchelliformis]|nr:Alpha/Beta hydrolase protein [Gautieria morchelliformis]